MADATLTISSKNYSSWCLRGWLITRLAGLAVQEVIVAESDEAARQELLLKSSSTLVPCLTHEGLEVWDTMGMAAYLNERFPEARMLPEDRVARARCWSISGEMHSGFAALRAALPMNLRSHRPGFIVWSSARADIDRILTIWRDCLGRWGGPFLFGDRFSLADAMYAPVCTRLRTYDVAVDPLCERYVRMILALPDMVEWTTAALREPLEVQELEVEF